MRGVYIRTDAARQKMSLSGMGRVASPETRTKQSLAHMGQLQSPESRSKLSKANMGHIVSPETRAKLWKGGRAVRRRKDRARRRALGYTPLNSWFAGSEGHHIDLEQIIYMPKELHRSVFHRQTDGRGMAQINAIAYNFLFKQEVEVAMSDRGQ